MIGWRYVGICVAENSFRDLSVVRLRAKCSTGDRGYLKIKRDMPQTGRGTFVFAVAKLETKTHFGGRWR